MEEKTILVTGAAGFIGAALVERIHQKAPKAKVIGIDNMNNYYDVSLKEYRVNRLTGNANFTFIRGDITDRAQIDEIFSEYRPQIVVHLAAQAGVRYSIENPDAYIQTNLIGFYHILEACRHSQDKGEGVQHLVFASSSSVYGDSPKIPYSIEDKADFPVSLYAATKRCDELLAHSYAKLYDIPMTGLRFFTVYGPAGRPDMAYFGFTDKLVQGETIEIYNYGEMMRDFTYIDDVTEGLIRVMGKAPRHGKDDYGLPTAPYALYNIGNNHPENLLDFVDILQEELVAAGVLPQDYDFESHKRLVPMQPGDVPVTFADTMTLEWDFGCKPNTSLREGLRKFAQWYAMYYKTGFADRTQMQSA